MNLKLNMWYDDTHTQLLHVHTNMSCMNVCTVVDENNIIHVINRPLSLLHELFNHENAVAEIGREMWTS